MDFSCTSASTTITIDPLLSQVADPEVIEHDEDHDEIALNSPASQEPEVTEVDELSDQEDKDKVVGAIEGVYRARPSDKDKDLPFVVLEFGGPSLLNILCKAIKI